MSEMERKRTIQVIVETKPSHTSGSVIYQPRVSMDRSEVVASVSGRQAEMYCNTSGIPSTGQITPAKQTFLCQTCYCSLHLLFYLILNFLTRAKSGAFHYELNFNPEKTEQTIFCCEMKYIFLPTSQQFNKKTTL